MTRRQILCGALALRPAKARIGMSRFSAITDEIARTPEGAIAFAKQYGIPSVELRVVPGQGTRYEELPENELRKAAAQFEAAGLRISLLDAGLLKFSLPGAEPALTSPESTEARRKRIGRDGELFERRMEHTIRALNAAAILTTDKVRVFTFSRVAEPLRLLPRIAGILEPLVDAAKKQKIRLVVENEPSCNAATCVELARLMELLPRKWAGINWDVHNGLAHSERPFPGGYRALPGERIANVHIKAASLLHEFEDRLDWTAIFETMLADGYKGLFGLETHIFGEKQIAKSHECMREIQRLIDAEAS